MGQVLPRLIFGIVAAFYAFGAFGHIASMAGMRGYDWADAPFKWQALNVVYLALDIVVIVGLMLRWRIGVGAFFIASVSQILLFTLFRAWVIDVPAKLTPAPDGAAYLNMVVGLHLAAVVLVLVALRMGALRKDGG